MTDFAFNPVGADGKTVANSVAGGKRPRSSMAPTIVMKDGKPYMAVGSPGGSRIIGFVAKTLVAHIDWGMDIQAAISLPNMLNRGSQYEIEEKTAAADKAAALEKLGYKSPSPRFEFRRTRHCDRQRRLLGGATRVAKARLWAIDIVGLT